MKKTLYDLFLENLGKDRKDIFSSTTLSASQIGLNNEPVKKIVEGILTETGNNQFEDDANIRMTPEEAEIKKSDLRLLRETAEYYSDNPSPVRSAIYRLVHMDDCRLRAAGYFSEEKWSDAWRKGESIKIDTPGSYENFKNINKNFIEQSEDIKKINLTEDKETLSIKNISDTKPLGDFGEMTLNQAYLKCSEVLLPIYHMYSDYNHQIICGTAMLTSFFYFKKVVSIYSDGTLSHYDLKSSISRAQRARDIRRFMIFSAPMIVFSLVSISKLFPTKWIVFQKEPSNVIENLPSSSQSSLFPPFLTTLFKRIPSWLKSLVVAYSIYYSIKYFFPDFVGNSNWSITSLVNLLTTHSYYVKLIYKIGIIIQIYMIIRYGLTIYFFIMFSKGKMKMPLYLPKTTLDWLHYIHNASIEEDKGIFIEIHVRYILIALFLIFLFSFLIYIY